MSADPGPLPPPDRPARLTVAGIYLLVGGSLTLLFGLAALAFVASYIFAAQAGTTEVVIVIVGLFAVALVAGMHFVGAIGVLKRRPIGLRVGLLIGAIGLLFAVYSTVTVLSGPRLPDGGVDPTGIVTAALPALPYGFVLWAIWTTRKSFTAPA